MKKLIQTTLSLISSALLLPILLWTTQAHADFAKMGVIKLENYHASGLFYRQVGIPFRITNSGYEKFKVSIGMDSEANDYTYDLTLVPNKTNIVQLSSIHNVFCIINFTVISPTQATFNVSDGTQYGCGINEMGSIAFNFSYLTRR